MNVDRLSLAGGGQIQSGTGGENILGRFGGSGQGGAIYVNAREAVSIEGKASTGQPSGIFASSEAPATGSAGKISITVPFVQLTEGGVIQSTTEGAGNAGEIALQVDRLVINQGSNINTSTAGGTGQRGDIRINADESVTISGKFFTGLAANSQAPATGDAGTIRITTPLVEINSGMILSGTNSVGNAGMIELDVDRLVLNEGGKLSTITRGTGRGGTIQVKASEGIFISGINEQEAATLGPFAAASGLFANSNTSNSGSAGTVRVITPLIELSDLGSIQSATVGSGDSGAIELTVDRLVLTRGGNIHTSTTGGAGQGGTIQVNAKESVVIEGKSSIGSPSTVASNSFPAATGKAGAIHITTSSMEIRNNGTVESRTGGSGDASTIELTVDRLGSVN